MSVTVNEIHILKRVLYSEVKVTYCRNTGGIQATPEQIKSMMQYIRGQKTPQDYEVAAESHKMICRNCLREHNSQYNLSEKMHKENALLLPRCPQGR